MLHFSTRNNRCEFFAFFSVLLQSNIQLFYLLARKKFWNPVCTLSFFYYCQFLLNQALITHWSNPQLEYAFIFKEQHAKDVLGKFRATD